ncbi:vacuolar protein sorting-associated protein 53 [Mayamaea pseudoterrestris]|nr:vacuolar protein sorting-associated protein 53 [Mayamaea pseudoterrestris]
MAPSPTSLHPSSLSRVKTRPSVSQSGPPMAPNHAPDPVQLLSSLASTSLQQPSAFTAKLDISKLSIDETEAAGFEPIDFLNKHYCSEAALVQQLPLLREAVAEKIYRLDDRINNALQRQSETADSTRRHVQQAKSSVKELQHRILQVRDKASQSESAVLRITQDMKRLDYAKQHLQQTITSLKRLHMLVNAVEQLRICCLSEPYPDFLSASQLVEATNLLMDYFSGYTHKVQPMRLLSKRITGFQEFLKTSLVQGVRIAGFGLQKTMEMEGKAKTKAHDDESLLDCCDHENDEGDHLRQQSPTTPIMTPDVMRGGVALIDALGPTVRDAFICGFCQDHLASYVLTFEPSSNDHKLHEKRVSSFKIQAPMDDEKEKVSGLDKLEMRFHWFQQTIQKIDRKFPAVFPAGWNLHASMARYFLKVTRDHILALLSGPSKDDDANNATILLKALQTSIVFEKDITGWLQNECGTVFLRKGDQDIGLDESQTSQATTPLIGIASGAFQNYMRPYISLEEQNLTDLLKEALEDRTVDTRGERPVFTSSTNLFVYIKGSITRCTALSKGKVFFMLCRAFKDALRKYALVLDRKLPIAAQSPGGALSIGGTFGQQQRVDNAISAHYRVPMGEEVTVCHVVSTCEYCADTLEALEELIRDMIDSEFKSKIDMMSDQEVYHDITAKSIRVLVSGLTRRVEDGLKPMLSHNWTAGDGGMDSAGEESAYVRTMHDEIEPYVIQVRSLLPISYFRTFCDKFASNFIVTYNYYLTRLKNISEPGSQQLLLDVYNLKTLFQKLPIIEEVAPTGVPGKKPLATGSTIAPAMYSKMVSKQFMRLEILLKLVGTPETLLVDNFKAQWSDGTAQDFVLVLSLKGYSRSQQAGWLEKFGLDADQALKGVTTGVTGASIVQERIQGLQDQGSTVARDLYQMRQKVDVFRKTFRTNSGSS